MGITLHGAHHMTGVKVELDKSRKELGKLDKRAQESRLLTWEFSVQKLVIDVFYCPEAKNVQPIFWQQTNFRADQLRLLRFKDRQRVCQEIDILNILFKCFLQSQLNM